jgi:hypothetical protein
MVENIGAELEREIPGRIIIRAAYVGTMGHREYASYNLNALPLQYIGLGTLLNQNIKSAAAISAGIASPYPAFSGTVAQALTPYPQYTAVTNLEAQIGNSSYNSLQINVQRHFGTLTFLANATISKYLTMSDNPGNGNSIATLKAQTYQLPGTAKSLGGRQPATNGGQSGDIPKQMNLSWYWNLPVGRGKRFLDAASGPINAIVGDWKVSAIQYYQDGVPLAVTSNETIPSIGAIWPVRNPSVPFTLVRSCTGIHSGADRYLNPAAFSDPAPYTLGNVSVLPTARACGYFSEDLGAEKGFSFGADRRFSIGTVVTNVFNRHQFNHLNTNIDSSTFGTFSGANSARTVQFNAKIMF